MSSIDFHAHIVPSEYPACPAGIDEPAWPRMNRVDDKHSEMIISGKVFRVFESFYWDVAERIEQLEQHELQMEVLSPLPELLSYWLNADAAVVLTDFMNGFIGDMVRKAPDRFQGLGAVALQDPARAVQQLKSLRREHGLKGIHVGSNVNGKSLADASFYPVWEVAQQEDLIVFVHGVKPAGLDRMLGTPMLAPVLGVPHENSMAVASFIMTDILGKFPGLKLVFSHGGGGLGAIIDRFDSVWRKFAVMRVNGSTPPIEYAKRFHYDTVTFGAEYLGFLVKTLGADRFVAGSDGPTEIGQTDLAGFLARAGLSDAERTQVIGGNARKLLGL